ncbi:MAG: carbon storage regulator [Novipirellula sp. JB048]
MLVLTRKLDEKIQIGDDITITLVRIQGNTVRIGIDAPREIRVVRAELESYDKSHDEAAARDDLPLRAREEAFAHPTLVTGRSAKHRVNSPASPADQAAGSCGVDRAEEVSGNAVPAQGGGRVACDTGSQVYLARVPVAGEKIHQKVAPLAAFLQSDVNVGIAQ